MEMKPVTSMNMLDPFGKGFLPGQVKPPSSVTAAVFMRSRPLKTTLKSSSYDLVRQSQDGRKDQSK